MTSQQTSRPESDLDPSSPFSNASKVIAVQPRAAEDMQIESAFRSGVEQRIWKTLLRSADQAGCLETIRAHSTFSYYAQPKGHRGQRFLRSGALTPMPIILDREAIATLEHGEAAMQNAKIVMDATTRWWHKLPGTYLVNANQNLYGYNEVCAWSPLVPRRIADYMSGELLDDQDPTAQAQKLVLETEVAELQLPNEFPMLAFLFMQTRSMDGYIELPAINDQEDQYFKDVVRAAYTTAQHPRPTVLTPHFFGYAVEEGLMAWVRAIHNVRAIVSWTIQQPALDVRILSLWFGEAEEAFHIPLRAYQLGLDGIERVLACVEAVTKEGRANVIATIAKSDNRRLH
jgi:hypothetical protein